MGGCEGVRVGIDHLDVIVCELLGVASTGSKVEQINLAREKQQSQSFRTRNYIPITLLLSSLK